MANPEVDAAFAEVDWDEVQPSADSSGQPSNIGHQDPALADVALPGPAADAAALTDSELARQAIHETLAGRFLYAKGLGWMAWDGTKWVGDSEAAARHAVDLHLRGIIADEAKRGASASTLRGLTSVLSLRKVAAVTAMAADNPAIYRQAGDFDAHPDLINTPGGVVDLRTGEVRGHDPALMLTKITRGSYRPGSAHPDWTQALEALPAPERAWYQARIGQAITGHPTPDGIMPVLQGGGENGKTALTTDGLVPALGDYADVASPKLVMADKPGRSEHSTERADLRGQRLLIGEELSEGRSLDITALKRIQDVGRIKARHVHKDNISFDASHSLFVTTNHVPVVSETDHGTWRRLALVKFPYTFRGSAEECTRPADRVGDPGLKPRIKAGADGQHDAIVTWAVEGARRWYADGAVPLRPTERIKADTLSWRASADRILGFWSERLIPEPGTCILRDEMYEVFTAWLKGNRHEAWSLETFTQAFAEHHETTRHGVEERRTRNLDHVSRRPLGSDFEVPRNLFKQERVWIGARFRTPADQPEEDARAGCAGVGTNSHMRPCTGKFAQTPAHPAHTPETYGTVTPPAALFGADSPPANGSRTVTTAGARQVTCPWCGDLTETTVPPGVPVHCKQGHEFTEASASQ